MNKLQDTALLVARILMPVLFIVAGWGKINGYTATAGYMTSMGVPSFFLPLTILLEFGGGLAILFGFFTRTTALITAIFTILTALIFHTDFAQGVNQMMFMKNLSIAGGFFVLFASGPGAFSIDRLIKKNW
ncbi:DoxX family protein [Rahnella sp. C60]|uniref:DoxX family protein n=1 Tax=Rahnella perminowiae TaxID=2816244 RepID=A0ABS6KZK4_9GAMM|nr:MULTISPECIES: DoxX family protein [Rahnella]UJD91101.1 DoxX family protein [Rahnella aquatilis]MBU9808660.1 DoxX family protein [Rahnella perminowiae]MBU9817021.1 DoxX family protein [Rahnella perminowiae]MBU9825928.1 DoxX family protein [Rahnella perminowiae]MBU9834959.1 DoxX family protein [Rahnella perminowiae]